MNAPRFPILVTAVITLAVAGLSGLFGRLALLLHGESFSGGEGPPALVGVVLGGAAGLLAGPGWCWAMFRFTPRWVEAPDLPVGTILGAGTLLGGGASVVATLLLHAGLQAWVRQFDLAHYWVGLAFGVPVGLLAGLAAGAAWLPVVRRFRPARMAR